MSDWSFFFISSTYYEVEVTIRKEQRKDVSSGERGQSEQWRRIFQNKSERENAFISVVKHTNLTQSFTSLIKNKEKISHTFN